jgi:hypothetical protein
MGHVDNSMKRLKNDSYSVYKTTPCATLLDELRMISKKLGSARRAVEDRFEPQSVITKDERLTVLLNDTPFDFFVGVVAGEGVAVLAAEVESEAVFIAGTGRTNLALPRLGRSAVDLDGSV